ncbi:ArsR family transcriptional regulator [Actinoplanes sp. SE50]|uniref:ArsR/SmtB family transcription factor n=1 Tax=unclassified Actinoplanes TaxID=2626549 RepID=UPI00023EC1CC|nr:MULTISPECIES: winged helix-turn-helix domain-containing protein [unclassified Actinoplanes]AEV81330.1 transcriptional regulator, ArsR family [Actinoplanes sp. SE50/110]ATO79733.1 ArsR family transcriptional regulator [Actinoplanes sp. SE50]SLL97136.1 transcriptional regulator [Actinoplanes sp. SE50/110]
MAERENVRVSDARTLRALAHPARIEIVDHLNVSGATVTATEMAGLVGLSPSATSYHLRELAKYGLVEQAPSQGDGRERRWRATGKNLWLEAEVEQPEALAAERALIDMYLSRDRERIYEWLDRQGTETTEWREASVIMGQQLLVSAAELAKLNEQVRTLIEPYRVRDRQENPTDGARRVAVQYLAFPMD